MKKPLDKNERTRILKLRENGMSIQNICRELHRGKPIISAFIRDPVKFTEMMENDVQYTKLQNNTTPKPSNKKKPTSSSSTPATTKNGNSNKKTISTPKGELVVTNVSMEHRSVIKFLVLDGLTPIQIYNKMKKVYNGLMPVPNKDIIEYWVKEFKKDPSTILFHKPRSKTIIKTIKKVFNKNTSLSSNVSKKTNDNNEKANTSSSSGKNLLTFRLFEDEIKNKLSL